VIGRPTTEQVLLDCCRVLADDVLPAVADETTRVRLAMLDKVLRNAAVRAAHEIAWMREEVAAIRSYAQAAAAATGDDDLRAALDAPAGEGESLHLSDVVDGYCRAGDLLSASLEAALDADRADLVARGESLLRERLAHESAVVGGWNSAGR
jgi:hypothetical protein